MAVHHRTMALNLLIIDDSELIRASLRGLTAGIPGVATVHTAASLTLAMESIRNNPPDMVILDLHLPDGSALNFIPTLREQAPGVQIAVLTNDAHAFNRAKCLGAGARWFFDKSTEFSQLLDVARQQAALCQPNQPRNA
jgi:DNA-binding NarL/FixJ family response regulator